jgi:CheY-like chemotaxis protein
MTGSEGSQPPTLRSREQAAHVLVVDDSEIMCELAARMLREFGCSAELALGGRRGLELLAERSFDVVLMDCQMPDLDGYSVVREYRLLERVRGDGRRTPIVAMTGDTGAECRAACLAAGMDDYLGKPFKVAALCSMIERWSGRSFAPSSRPGPG